MKTTEIKRPDGSTVKIDVALRSDSFSPPRWVQRVWIKRKFKRDFSIEPTAATSEEIQEAKLQHWESLKPIIDDRNFF